MIDIINPQKVGDKNLSFDGTNDNVFYEDDYIRLRWESGNNQFQFYVKHTDTFWYDSGIVIYKTGTTSPSTSNGDLSSSTNSWRYFNDGGSLNTSFNLAEWGSWCIMTITSEEFSNRSKLPTYLIFGGIGASNNCWVSIKKIK